MTETVHVVNGVLLDHHFAGGADKHVDTDIDTNGFTGPHGRCQQIGNETIGWGSNVAANVEFLHGKGFLPPFVKINLVAIAIGDFVESGRKAPVRIETVPFNVHLGPTGTIGTTVVHHVDGPDLSVKHVEFVLDG